MLKSDDRDQNECNEAGPTIDGCRLDQVRSRSAGVGRPGADGPAVEKSLQVVANSCAVPYGPAGSLCNALSTMVSSAECTLIKKKYPDLIKAMVRKWDMNEDDLPSNSYYVNLEDYLF